MLFGTKERHVAVCIVGVGRTTGSKLILCSSVSPAAGAGWAGVGILRQFASPGGAHDDASDDVSAGHDALWRASSSCARRCVLQQRACRRRAPVHARVQRLAGRDAVGPGGCCMCRNGGFAAARAARAARAVHTCAACCEAACEGRCPRAGGRWTVLQDGQPGQVGAWGRVKNGRFLRAHAVTSPFGCSPHALGAAGRKHRQRPCARS